MRRLGLRARITTVFALGALALSASLAVATYEITRGSLLEERERAAVRAAYLDASFLRTGLGGQDPDIVAVLQSLDTGDVRRPLVRRDGQWFARSADNGLTTAIPAALQELVDTGTPAVQRVPLRESSALVVGVPLTSVDASYYEISPLTELERTLSVLARALAAVALVTTLAGAVLGWWVSRRVLRPLASVAGAAGSIASGDFTARVARDTDPDLDKLAVSFNRMVDEVSARSEADRRFAADVSHELRSPLQTLSAATTVLERRREALDGRTAAAVDLLTAEVARFESLVTDLLELAKSDRPAERRPTDVAALTRAFVAARRLPPGTLDATGAAVLDVDPRRYEQVLANLVDNATKHGGGVVRIGLEVADDQLVLEVDDEGAGVPLDERDLVFDRFARGRAASMRGGSDGTGLGLALVTQHVQAHRGTVEVLDRPGGGARFRVVLPGEPQ